MPRLPALVAFAALAAACAAPPPPRPPLSLAPFTTLRAAHFPGAAAVLDGFAPPDDDPQMRAGDAALLGIEITNGRAVERQLLLVELYGVPWQLDAKGQPLARLSARAVVDASTRNVQTGVTTDEQRSYDVKTLAVRLDRSTADGARQRRSELTLYEEPLAAGFWPYAEPRADTTQSDLAGILTTSLQDLAGRDPVLQELLFRVVDAPSLWSVATHLGVTVTLRWDPAAAHAVALGDAAPSGDAVRLVPLELVVNGDVAAHATLLVARPRGAHRMVGGLVGAIVQNAADPSRLAVVRLLGTRRGG